MYSEQPNPVLRPNPLIAEMQSKPAEYGFTDSGEVRKYAVHILKDYMRNQSSIMPLRDGIGFRGVNSVDELLERYPLDEFRMPQRKLEFLKYLYERDQI